jgi:hypothetical protein
MELKVGAENKVELVVGTVAHRADVVAFGFFKKIHFENVGPAELVPNVDEFVGARHKCFQVWVVKGLQDFMVAVFFVGAGLPVVGVYSELLVE